MLIDQNQKMKKFIKETVAQSELQRQATVFMRQLESADESTESENETDK